MAHSPIAPKTSSALRTLEALEILAALPKGLTASELALTLSAHRNAAYRALETLVVSGFAIKEGSPARYRTSGRMIRMTHSHQASQQLSQNAHAHLINATLETGHAFHLGRLDGTRIVVIERSDTTDAAPAFLARGATYPAHCSSGGRAILAFNPRDLAAEVIQAGLTQETVHTITDHTQFLTELDRIQDAGFALDINGTFAGWICLSVPIVSSTTPTTTCLTLSLDARVGSVETLIAALPVAQQTAAHIAAAHDRS